VTDSAQLNEQNTVRSYQTTLVIPSDETVVVKGQWAADNYLVDILVNGNPTGISQTSADSFGQLHQFELTRGRGLFTGTNGIVFKTRQRRTTDTDPNPHGLLVAWDPTGCLGSLKGCDGATLDQCVSTKTVTIASGTGSYAIFNGVHTVTKVSGSSYWRLQVDPANRIDLLCVQTDRTYRWQGGVFGPTTVVKRFGRNDDVNCPPNGSYTCFAVPSEGSNCSGSMTFTVSD
jgi:hypothetical protein